jgi:hypothetical protein
LKAKKLILAGGTCVLHQHTLEHGRLTCLLDHCQLPPTIISEGAAKAGLSHTLFDRYAERLALPHLFHHLINGHFQNGQNVRRYGASYAAHPVPNARQDQPVVLQGTDLALLRLHAHQQRRCSGSILARRNSTKASYKRTPR